MIIAKSTPVPPENWGKRNDSDVIAYNAVALKIMKENNIPVDDLYAFVRPIQGRIQNPGDVHYKPIGYQILGKTVTRSILETLGREVPEDLKPQKIVDSIPPAPAPAMAPAATPAAGDKGKQK